MTIEDTTTDKRNCAQRELNIRKFVYPRWVEQRRMSAGRAELEIAIMQAIVADYDLRLVNEQLL